MAPWLVELARTLPGALRSHLPGAPLGARSRERVLLAAAEAADSAPLVWVHRAWLDFLGGTGADGAGAAADDDVERALRDYAAASVDAGRPLDATPLEAVLPPAAVDAARAAVARIVVGAEVVRRGASLVDRVRGRRRPDPLAAAVEGVSIAAAAPVVVPLLAAAASMQVATRLAPPVPEVASDERSNLLVHLLARTVPAYLANAGVRTIALRLPVPVSIGVRTGRSAATVRLGRGRVEVVEGIAADAVVVVQGDVEPLLQLAAGSLVRDLANLRVRRD